jgi:hypothetical protein
MLLEFSLKKHYGRVDLYPANEAARAALEIKKMQYEPKTRDRIKCLSVQELDVFKMLGHEVKVFQEYSIVDLKKAAL